MVTIMHQTDMEDSPNPKLDDWSWSNSTCIAESSEELRWKLGSSLRTVVVVLPEELTES